ncbi:hypothetical protein ACLX1H_000056 [Fusarium chlamydosporum]
MSTLLQTCSYHRGKYWFPLLQTNDGKVPEELFEPLGLPTTTNNPPTEALTKEFPIFKLPVEIVTNILAGLDVKSFHSFRQVTRIARDIANAVPQYQQVVRYGPEGVKALYRMSLHDQITYKNLHRALVTEKCRFCGDFGGLLFVVTCTRCCYNCLRTAPEIGFVDWKLLAFSYRYVLLLECSSLHESFRETMLSARDRFLKIQNWEKPEVMLDRTQGMLAKQFLEILGSVGLLSEWGIDAFVEKGWLNYRSAVCIAYPWLNQRTMTTERGVSCKGCHNAFVGKVPEDRRLVWYFPYVPSGSENRDRSFSQDGFKRHFESCEHARKMWDDSEG